MQTAIQWLEKQYLLTNGKLVCRDFEYAEKLEKQQIIDAYMARMDITDKEYFKQIIGGQYYNETFKKD